jgi:predicted DNA-binding protein YlxM (UPF0122 family)
MSRKPYTLTWPQKSKVMELRLYEGFSITEIAMELKVPRYVINNFLRSKRLSTTVQLNRERRSLGLSLVHENFVEPDMHDQCLKVFNLEFYDDDTYQRYLEVRNSRVATGFSYSLD